MTAPLVLHKYQRQASDFINSSTGCAIFGDCGVGKTIITLTSISELLTDFSAKGVLLVAPLRVARLTWPLEIEEWSEFNWMKYQTLHGPNKVKNLSKSAQIYIINYEGLDWLEPWMAKNNHKKWPFDVVVWDELTKLKNPSSSRFKKFKKFLRFFSHRVGLTGTPTPNGYMDLWSQMFAVDLGESLGKTFTGYKDRFFHPRGAWSYDYDLNEGAERIIQSLISPVSMRISAEDHLNVPPLTITDIDVDLPKSAMTKYNEFERDMFVEIAKGETLEAPTAAVLSNKCLQLAGGSVYLEDEDGSRRVTRVHDVKLEALKVLRSKIKGPMIVAYSFKHERDIIMASFPQAVALKGGMSIEREQSIQRDWDAGKIDMLIVHPASAGHGLNLQKSCKYGVWYSLSWSLELYQQLIARIHRQGQKSPVEFFRIIARDTLDEAVSVSLGRKKNTQDSLLSALRKYRLSK